MIKSFLRGSIYPSSTQKSFSISWNLKHPTTIFFPIKNLFCLITKIYCWTDALSSTKLGLTKVYISSKIFWTQMVKLCRTQNLKRNIFYVAMFWPFFKLFQQFQKIHRKCKSNLFRKNRLPVKKCFPAFIRNLCKPPENEK